MSSLPISKILKSGYSSNEEARDELIKYGYVLDKKLSSHNQKVFFNPKTNRLLMTVAGTHNYNDVITDLRLLAGDLKNTNRYKEAKKVLEKSRVLYPSASEKVDIVSHSLGGSIGSRIGKNKDNIISYNKGSTFGEISRLNEKSYRTAGDLVSLLAPNTETLEKETKNLRANQKEDQKPTFFKSHNSNNIDNIFLPVTKEDIKLEYDPNAGDSVEFQNYSLNDY